MDDISSLHEWNYNIAGMEMNEPTDEWIGGDRARSRRKLFCFIKYRRQAVENYDHCDVIRYWLSYQAATKCSKWEAVIAMPGAMLMVVLMRQAIGMMAA